MIKNAKLVIETILFKILFKTNFFFKFFFRFENQDFFNLMGKIHSNNAIRIIF